MLEGLIILIMRATSLLAGNAFNPFLHKRRSFEHEREVRAIHWISSEKGFAQDVCDTGIYSDIDVSLLIKGVIVAPYADSWFLELVKSVAIRYGLEAPVNKSSLAGEPWWDPLNRGMGSIEPR